MVLLYDVVTAYDIGAGELRRFPADSGNIGKLEIVVASETGRSYELYYSGSGHSRLDAEKPFLEVFSSQPDIREYASLERVLLHGTGFRQMDDEQIQNQIALYVCSQGVTPEGFADLMDAWHEIGFEANVRKATFYNVPLKAIQMLESMDKALEYSPRLEQLATCLLP